MFSSSNWITYLPKECCKVTLKGLCNRYSKCLDNRQGVPEPQSLEYKFSLQYLMEFPVWKYEFKYFVSPFICILAYCPKKNPDQDNFWKSWLVLRFNNRWRWRRGRFNFRQNTVIGGLSEVTFQLEFFTLVLVVIFKITLGCSN